MQPDVASSGAVPGAGPGGNEPLESDVVDMCRFRAGDRGALVVIIARHETAVRRLLVGLWDDRHEVEDLCQEVFLRLIEHLPDPPRGESLRPWLYRTAINLVRDRARRRRVRQWFKLVAWRGHRHAVEAAQAADTKLERQELVDRLRGEIQRLQPAWREVVVLRDLQGLSPKEAGEVLGLSDKVVTDRLYRARRALAARLKT